ncbi:MAG: Bax inhibitor-1 family protein [Opitutales bacterium]|jgi:FtsH-binding integral membrane protein
MQEQTFSLTAAESPATERAAFIRRTYSHLALAILAFIGLEYYLVHSPFAMKLAQSMTSGFSWLLVLGAFMFVGYVADRMARSQTSEGMQYFGLGLYVIAEAIIFLPLLVIATHYSDPSIIGTAGLMTLLLVAGLTATVFITKKDFSFLRGILSIGFFVALGFIVCSFIFGFSLGLVFSCVMVVLAAGSVLYTTSNILHHYHPSQHVAASLAIFASVALLFWYVLQILMSFAGND